MNGQENLGNLAGWGVRVPNGQENLGNLAGWGVRVPNGQENLGNLAGWGVRVPNGQENTGNLAEWARMKINMKEYEAKAPCMLSSTDLSISEIAFRLNFTSLTVFGKYFKRVTGLSPNAYRNRKV